MKFADLLDTLNRDTAVDVARLLILMEQLDARSDDSAIHGIGKLATLDFLLANPTYLARALLKIKRSTKALRIQPFEEKRASNEVAYLAFEPWDHAHRRVVASMLARSLIAFGGVNQGSLRLYLTESGQEIANKLSTNPAFELMTARAKVVCRDFDLEPESLQRKIVRLLPELQTLGLSENLVS